MGLIGWILWGRGRDLSELARRLEMRPSDLRRFQPKYRTFSLPKRSGGERTISAPDTDTKQLQRRILKRLLQRLPVHAAAMGFETGRSIVTNAVAHQGRAVVLKFDIVDFFPSTSSRRVKGFFRRVGWNRQVANVLEKLVTHQGGLPQGAPTSPRLSNLLNYRIDARLEAAVKGLDGAYTRYADDITISLQDPEADEGDMSTSYLADCLTTLSARITFLSKLVRRIVGEEGYQLHGRKKTSVRRQHHRQQVTGLVVNQDVQLPRETRRWLRAVEHRMRMAKDHDFLTIQSRGYAPRPRPTLTESQLAGWQSLRAMIEHQKKARSTDHD
jgi:RNA-directed DNA polymerase